MRKFILFILMYSATYPLSAQPVKTECYDLIKKLLTDSTGYENVGDWGVGKPKRFPVAWKADRLDISDDTSINFYRQGTAAITINGHSFMQRDRPTQWNVLLKGPRSGYSSFSIVSSGSSDMRPGYMIDSIFGKRPFVATLLKSCNTNGPSGFYYYQLKLPKKDIAFIKLSWLSIGGSTAIRIDCFDNWSQYAAKLNCPK